MYCSEQTIFKNKRLGVSSLRTEDLSLLTGTGRYADDLPVAKDQRSIAFVRSPYAHARIISIDTSRALSIPGVDAIVTGEEVATLTDPFIVGVKLPMHQYPLAVEKVRYFGEAVCMVIASNRYIAEDALDRIRVEYELLEALIDPQASAGKDAPILHEQLDSNIVHEREFSYGNVDGAFADARHTIGMQVKYPRNSGTPIECFHVSAKYNAFEDVYEVTANFQGPFSLHPVIAHALRVPGNRLRLKTPPDSGGSYGVKQAIFPYIVACCAAARISGRSVQWHEDRLEHLSSASSATNRVMDIQAAVDDSGRIHALRFDQLDDCGAFLRAPEPATLYRMHGNLNGAYDIENINVRNRVVVTNKTPTGLVRGFGGPQLYFAIERLIDKIAKSLSLDPVDIRKLNAVKQAQMPYKTASGALLDSGNYSASIDRALVEGGYEKLAARREAARKEGRLYGIGCAAVVEPSVSNMGYIAALLTPEMRKRSNPKNGAIATVTVAFDASGSITVNTASVPQGQGHRTVLAQVVAEVFDLDPNCVVVSTDHDTVKDDWSIASGNYSSRFAASVAGTAYLAAQKLRDKIARMAASSLDVSTEDIRFNDGCLHLRSNDAVSIPLARITASAHWAPLSIPKELSLGLRETVNWSLPTLEEVDEKDRINSSGAYGFIFDFCGIEICRITGNIRIDDYVTMHDAGRLLNPMLANGQIRGGFAHGLGAALLEEFSYAPNGAFLNGTLADYLIPTACEVPALQILHDENPSPFTPLGAKGLGEGNCMSTPVCIANAAADALGIENIQLPLTKSRVAELIYTDERPASATSSTPPPLPLGKGHGVTGYGSLLVDAAIEDVWELMLDDRALANIIPGCNELDELAPNEYRAEMTIGVGPIKGQFTTSVALRDLVPPTALRLVGGASGPLGESKGEGRVMLTEKDQQTEISYQYSVLISGKAASVGGRMLDGATRSFIDLFFKKLISELGVPQKESLLRRFMAALTRFFGGRK